jgi:hypothetical protein
MSYCSFDDLLDRRVALDGKKLGELTRRLLLHMLARLASTPLTSRPSRRSKADPQQIVLAGWTCGSIHNESFKRNMKALGGLERTRSTGGDRRDCKAREHDSLDMYV